MRGQAGLAGAMTALVLLGTGSAVARADTYCVHDPAVCPGESVETLSEAIRRAGATDGSDAILIGAGTFIESFSTLGTRGITITGAGRDQTVLVAPAGTGGAVVDREDTVSGLTIEARDGSASGLEVAGTARDIAVLGPARGVTVRVYNGGTLAQARITVRASDGIGVQTLGPQRMTLEDLRISGPSGASAVRGIAVAGVTTVRRSIVTAGTPIDVQGASIDLSDSVADAVGAGSASLRVQGADAAASASATNFTATNGSALGTVVVDGAQHTASLVLDSSAIGTIQRSASSGSANVTLSYSAYQGVRESGGGSTTLLDGNLPGGDARLRGGGADAVPQYGSALIDAGNPGAASTTDVVGASRVADGDGDGRARRDIGAFELQAPPAKPAGAAPGGQNGTTGNGTGSGGGPAPASDAIGLARIARAALSADGRSLRVKFSCLSASPCDARIAAAARLRGRLLDAGSASGRVHAGSRTVFVLRLSSAARRALRGRTTAPVQVSATVTAGTQRAVLGIDRSLRVPRSLR